MTIDESKVRSDATESVAVIPVRAGVLPLGAAEVIAEAGGPTIVIGTGVEHAASQLESTATQMWLVNADAFSPSGYARDLATTVRQIGADGNHLLLPASPDGRDMGPRVAALTGRPFVAGAVRIEADRATVTRHGGQVEVHLGLVEPVVVTLQPGIRHVDSGPAPTRRPDRTTVNPGHRDADVADPRLLTELPPDPSTMDLAESKRIVCGGAGLGSSEELERLVELCTKLGASPGATRVVTDHGWLPTERQIGTTGVTVNPALYMAIGVSGAVQHTAGLGDPTHIISINTDPHCPMMGMADLALVCDAPAFVSALLAELPTPKT